MRRALVCVVVAGCAGSPKPPRAERLYYAVAAGSTFAGAPSAAISLDVSFADGTAFVLRADQLGVNQGFGHGRADGTYDMVFYRHVPAERVFPYPRRYNNTLLLVIHGDGRGVLTRADRTGGAFRSTLRGDELVLDGDPVGHTIVHLASDSTATLTGDLRATRAVYARFDDALLIAVSFDASFNNLGVGRYDFAHGRGENASPRGRGIETFSRR